MICNVSHDDVVDAVEIHWGLQLGSYFGSVHDIDGAVYNLGKRVKDYYWNYAGLIRTSKGEEVNLIKKIIDFAQRNDRVPAVYIDPTVTPPSFVDTLKKKSFQPEDEEIWMFYTHETKIDIQHPMDLKITKVQSNEDMMTFVRVFNESFGLIEDGKENSDYGLSLMDAYSDPNLGVNIVHFIGWVSNNPVSVASTYLKNNTAGIYNVGTPEEFRGHGYGTSLSKAAIQEALSNNCRRLLLQTELDSGPERLYSRLGFKQAFSAGIWSMKD